MIRWAGLVLGSITLPVHCPCCKTVVSSADVNESARADCDISLGDAVSITCPDCVYRFDHHLSETKGDSRNIALIGHWDGWQPFPSVGSIAQISRLIFVKIM